MSLSEKITPGGYTVFSAYNVIPQEMKKGRVRDAAGITVGPKELMGKLDELRAAGHHFANAEAVADGTAPQGAVCLMLCDGYDLTDTDLLEYAEEHGIPLSFSFATSLVGNNTPSWTNQIEIALEDALKASDGDKVTLNVPGTSDRISFSTVEFAIATRNHLKDAKPADVDGQDFVHQVCQALSEATGREITATMESNSRFDKKMTWGQVRGLKEAGHTLISHGTSHTNPYTNRTDDEIRTDVTTALDKFEEETGEKPIIMTYPEGETDERVIGIIEETGIRAAFTMEQGVIFPESDTMALSRYTLIQDMLKQPEPGFALDHDI